MAAALSFLVVGGALAALLFALNSTHEDVADPLSHLTAADVALSEGRLRHAVVELGKAREIARSQGDALTAAELRLLDQRHREASLLADLLPESLEEILTRAARVPGEEWNAQFEKRYRGPGQANAVVFETGVRRDGAGQYQIDWELRAGNEPAMLEIDNLVMLRDLPLEQPRRLLFGARLESIARGQDGVWVVRFEPTSGVLLTDRVAVAACYPYPLDSELLNILEQQRNWLNAK